MKNWDDLIFRALAHSVRRRIIDCLGERKTLSFNELSKLVEVSNHGKLGFHMRALKGLVQRDSSTNKYCLTDRGRLASQLISEMRFMISRSLADEPAEYAEHLDFGDHAFLMYDTEDAKRRIAYSFMRAGLSKGDAVMYLVSEHKLDSESREIQKSLGIDDLSNKAFTIMSAEEWYLRKGKAQAKRIIANWQTILKEKQSCGFKGLRGVGEMEVFFNESKVEELFRYEARLGKQFSANLCGLCIYDEHRLDHKQIGRLINFHGHLLCRDMAWKIS